MRSAIFFQRTQGLDREPYYLYNTLDRTTYSQIIRFIKAGIVAGTIADGDELPSRRVLSALLGVNPNTIQKACRLLEEEGLLQSRTGARSFIAVTAAQAQAIRVRLLEEDALALVAAIRRMGVSREEAAALVERLWDEAERRREEI